MITDTDQGDNMLHQPIPTMPRDTYYRGYRLSEVRPGTPTASVHIRAMGDPDLISITPTVEVAKKVIDDWHNAR